MPLTLNDFDYNLPRELIAQTPAVPRDHSRLLIYDRSSQLIRDDHFYNIGDYLPEETSLVVNNSKVEKCRLLFNEGRIEIFVTHVRNDKTIEALVRPGKKFRPGKNIELTTRLTAETLESRDDGLRIIRLSHSLDNPAFDSFRYTPFPPYIERDENLSDRYQTVFAKNEGSKAAPTAGLHFTPELLTRLNNRGIKKKEVTLHVGLGTFAPVKTEKIENHLMHSEWFRITKEQAASLNQSTSITAVGTTSVRVLESAPKKEGVFSACSGSTDIFITPGYSFKSTDHLITNFHLPKSTLLMLVSAFSSLDEVKRIYNHAISEKYRFYSFGDAMLIL